MRTRRLTAAVTAVLAAAVATVFATAQPALAAPLVSCLFSSSSTVNPVEAWVYAPAPTTEIGTVVRTHQSSYNNCFGAVQSGLAVGLPETALSYCLEPFFSLGTETLTYTWNNLATSTIRYDSIMSTAIGTGAVLRWRQDSTGVVVSGLGAGLVVRRSTLFDPIAGCNGLATTQFGQTEYFTIG